MPSLNRAPNEKELEYLIRLFLRAETSIINEIGRLRSQGLVDYHAVAFSLYVQQEWPGSVRIWESGILRSV